MQILKVINNNIVSCLDKDGQEVIVMGKGLGFHAKGSPNIPDNQVEKVFRMENQRETDKLKALFSSLPIEYIQVSAEIIEYARTVLNKRLNENIYVTLTDHIKFAVLRHQQGMVFEDVLLNEVRLFYPQEYSVGQYALERISSELGTSLPIAEAANIALHIANAEYDTSISRIVRLTHTTQGVLEMIEAYPGICINKNSCRYDEFLYHLKFMVLQAFSEAAETSNDDQLNQVLRSMFPQEYACAERVAAYLEEQGLYCVSEETIAYLAIHIHYVNKKKE